MVNDVGRWISNFSALYYTFDLIYKHKGTWLSVTARSFIIWLASKITIKLHETESPSRFLVSK